MFSELGTGSNAEQHKNTEGQSTKRYDVRPYVQIHKHLRDTSVCHFVFSS